MTDNEIIEAMETSARITPNNSYSYVALKRGLELIYRQKEEIEKLTLAYVLEQSTCNLKIEMSEMIERELTREIGGAYEKAINDFVRELKDCAKYQHNWRALRGNPYVTVGEIDFIAEKMIGGAEDGRKEM